MRDQLACLVDAGCLRMILSPKDDPRTWLLPGAKRPPLQARLLYYDLTTSQYALLRSMLENAPEGGLWEASPETYAETSGVSVRHQYNLIHGWNRNGRHTPGFLESGVLTLVRKAQRLPRPKPAAYKFNEFKLRLRPELLSRLEAGVQQTLPGIRRLGEPAEDPPNRQPLPPKSATVADDSNATTSKPLIQERRRDSTRATSCFSLDARPTLEQVKTYCQQPNKGVDPQRWFDHYSANGWKIGPNAMMDWQASVRTWERNGASHGNGFGASKQTGAFHRSEVDYGGYDEYDNNPKPKL